MSRSLPKKKEGLSVFSICFLLLTVLHIFFIWNSHILPFIDLPFRLATAKVIRFYGESSNFFSDYFAVDMFPKPNIIHALFCSWKLFPSVEFANKIFYSLYIFLLPISTLLVIRKIKGNVWFAFLSFILLYNYSVSWGFSEFTMAIPLILFFFYFLLDYFEEGRWPSKLMTGFLLVVLFFTHSLASLYALLLFSACCFYRYRHSIKRMLVQFSITVPLWILFIAWWSHDSLQGSEYNGSYLLKYYLTEWLQESFAGRTRLLSLDNFSLFKGNLGHAIAALFSLTIILPVLIFWIKRRPTAPSIYKGRFLPSLFIFFLVSLAVYIFIPHEISGNYYLFPRFSVFVLISIVFLGSAVSMRENNRILKSVLLAVCLLHLILWGEYFLSFNRENRYFTPEIFPVENKEEVMGGLIYDNRFRGRPVYIHFPNYHIVWNEGIATTCVVDFSFNLIRRKAGTAEWPPTIRLEWVGRHGRYSGQFSDLKYILVKGDILKNHLKYFDGFVVDKSAGDWILYKKNFD